eukprot:scaffold31373_cov82-Skeletonema_dohrnii-CCMP3373.AAC.4
MSAKQSQSKKLLAPNDKKDDDISVSIYRENPRPIVLQLGREYLITSIQGKKSLASPEQRNEGCTNIAQKEEYASSTGQRRNYAAAAAVKDVQTKLRKEECALSMEPRPTLSMEPMKILPSPAASPTNRPHQTSSTPGSYREFQLRNSEATSAAEEKKTTTSSTHHQFSTRKRSPADSQGGYRYPAIIAQSCFEAKKTRSFVGGRRP